MRIGVLALQGAFIEHIRKLGGLGLAATEVRLPRDLQQLDGLIIPGGESTAIGKPHGRLWVDGPRPGIRRGSTRCGDLRRYDRDGQGDRAEQPLLGLMDIAVERNGLRPADRQLRGGAGPWRFSRTAPPARFRGFS